MGSPIEQGGFTKGPWEVDPENNVFVRDVDGNMIADCDVFQYTDDGEVQLDDCPANARLIAASPDLLAALRGLLNALSDTPLVDSHDAGVAFAAIAKATGGAA